MSHNSSLLLVEHQTLLVSSLHFVAVNSAFGAIFFVVHIRSFLPAQSTWSVNSAESQSPFQAIKLSITVPIFCCEMEPTIGRNQSMSWSTHNIMVPMVPKDIHFFHNISLREITQFLPQVIPSSIPSASTRIRQGGESWNPGILPWDISLTTPMGISPCET